MKRKKAIIKMYHYQSTEPRAMILPKTGEVIYNWYIAGFPNIEDLEKLAKICYLYDHDIDGKIFVKDKYKEA